MDINYFLLLKSKYNSMLSNIDELIETCETICEFNDDRGLYLLFNSEENMQVFVERKKQIQYLKNMCNHYIHSLCKHEFIEDVIDIDPDRSKTITYCRLCELNEDACFGFK